MSNHRSRGCMRFYARYSLRASLYSKAAGPGTGIYRLGQRQRAAGSPVGYGLAAEAADPAEKPGTLPYCKGNNPDSSDGTG